MDSTWFEDLFGFEEEPHAYEINQSRFSLVESLIESSFSSIPSPAPSIAIRSHANNSTHESGPFETISIRDLRQRSQTLPPCSCSLGGLIFNHIIGDAMKLHRDPSNAGAVLQAASQFNSLEMIGPAITPEHGITIYCRDHTQGPACALSCPAATVYRNYLHNQGSSGHQINLMEGVEKLLAPESYWTIKNGYLLPADSITLKTLSKRLMESSELLQNLRDEVKVACQWSTEVWDGEALGLGEERKRKHFVTQVFCSACPISYSKLPSDDWKNLAVACLEAAFEGTLSVASCLSRKQGRRVSVYLTSVGGGAFGNRESWIEAAIKRALAIFKDEALDVYLVHYGHLPEKLF